MGLPSEKLETAGKPEILVRTQLTLEGGVNTDIVTFSGLSDDKEHIALVFPSPQPNDVPLVRLHSECMTGDVFGSAHCDCGDQLAEARGTMAKEGGILIYLRQEGRGIGLYNKVHAYKLQKEQGLDTFEANRHIGFGDDLRDFKIAAEMLQALGVKSIRLLTNNPDKVRQLQQYGIEVDQIVPTGFYDKGVNRAYLMTKRKKGHLF